MIGKAVRLAGSAGSFLYTFYVLCNFTYFLSKTTAYDGDNELEEITVATKTLWSLLLNASLLSAFILQHSVMASDIVKDFYYKFDIEDVERCIYNASSAGVLHFLMNYWQPVSWISIWNFSSIDNSKLWLAVSICHFIAWCIIYSGCIMMDISELAGLKQIYYKISGRPRPMTMKSRELQRYFMHMRHPSFTGFLIILWIYPVMSLDRLLIASLLTVYMILMWTIDVDDYNYHSYIITKKEREFHTKNF